MPPALLGELQKTLGSAAAMRDNKRDYLLANRYPPGLVRLTPDMQEILQPNRAIALPRPIGVASKPEDEVYAVFDSDVTRTIGKDPVTLRLAVWRGQKDKTPLALKVVKTSVRALDPKTGFHDVDTFTLKAQPGTGERAAQAGALWVGNPSGALAGYNGLLDFVVHWEINGAPPQVSTVTIEYSDAAPARFTGVIKDEVVNGSLELTVGVEVDLPGRYNLVAPLFAADATKPVAASFANETLAAGPQQVKVRYFGLVFHDAKTPGPYVVRTLSGYMVAANATLGRGKELRRFDQPYTTKAYALDQFTTAEWDSPEKQGALKAMDAEIARLEKKGLK